MKDREKLPGLSWVGSCDYKSGVVKSEAFYKGERVANILRILGRVAGDSKKAAEILNEDAEVEDVGQISPKEVSKIARFASRHPIRKTKRLVVLNRQSRETISE